MTRKLLILLLSAAFLVVFPGLTLAQFGSISGRVTDEVTGAPLIGAHVAAARMDSMHHCHGEAWTDTGGYYMIERLHPGSYQVGASAVGYVEETYPVPVSVLDGQNTPDINFALALGGGGETGSISGTVTDEVTGLPIRCAHVIAVGMDNWCFGEAWTDSSGNYVVEGLCAGIWQVQAQACGYVPEVYPDTVIVMEGQNTPGINFALTPSGGGGTGSISGTVTDETTGDPVLGAHVVAMPIDSMCYGQGEAWTDSNGNYVIPNLRAGNYHVHTGKPGYIPETYPTPVTVVDGQNTPDIDFALTPEGGGGTGSISGTVTEEGTGALILGAHVVAMGQDSMCHGHGDAWTDSNGYYTIEGLSVGTYQVSAAKMGYVPENYPSPVTVVDGQNTSGIDFALTPMGEAGSISGTITNANTGNPIPHAHVSAYGEFGWGHARTDSLGHYTISGLFAGYYFVTAHACGYYPQNYPDTVTVLEGQNTPNIDFALVPYGGGGNGVIAGRVFDDSLQSPLSFAIVCAISWHGHWGFTFADSLGSYSISGLPADSYYVFAHAPGYIGEFYDNAYIWDEATLVTPDAYGIDFYLAPCGHGEGVISGMINSNGSPLEGAYVYAEAGGEVKGFAQSSTGGGYVINGLLPGVYTVSASMVSYHDGLYPVPVVIGTGKAGGIDINLPPVQVGDVNGNGAIDIGDVVSLINYLYKGGPAPNPMMTGDTNCDGEVNVGDVLSLINYLYKGGPSPCNP